MVVLTKLQQVKPLLSAITARQVLKRSFFERGTVFPIKEGNWQFTKAVDWIHFYSVLGAFSYGIIVLYANIFIGQSDLTELPKDYIPEEYEYYKSPITRWLVKHMYTTYQEDYERYMAYLYRESELILLRKLEHDVIALMKKRNDYKAWYYRPALGKYYRNQREASDFIQTIHGE